MARFQIRVPEDAPPGSILVPALRVFAHCLVDTVQKNGGGSAPVEFDLMPYRDARPGPADGSTSTRRVFSLDAARSQWVADNARHGALARALAQIVQLGQSGAWPQIQVGWADRQWRIGPLSRAHVPQSKKRIVQAWLPREDMDEFRGRFVHGALSALVSAVVKAALRRPDGQIVGFDFSLGLRAEHPSKAAWIAARKAAP